MESRNRATSFSWQELLGIEFSPVSHRERLLSALGGFLSIIIVFAVSLAVLDTPDTPILVLSMGSSAVLLFAVPHGAMAQPWPLIGGHLIAAVIGVACARYLQNPILATSLAVGLSIGFMHYLRCIHPPAGATALAAVMGGSSVQALGFAFALVPVLLNVALILGVAIAFNAIFPWRRYPMFLARRTAPVEAFSAGYQDISHEDFVYALTQMDSFIDVSEEDLLRIYGLATGRHRALEQQAAEATTSQNIAG